MKTWNQDDITGFFRKAINILLVENPQGTSIGILIGIVLDGVWAIFAPMLKAAYAINVYALKFWHFIGLGVISMNIPHFLSRNKVDPKVENTIKFIATLRKEGKITEYQAELRYSQLCDEAVTQVCFGSNKERPPETSSKLATENSGDR